jgi:hypothetical protein
MRCLDRMLLAATVPILVACVVACTPDGPGTSVRVALTYDDSLGLDTAEVTLGDRTQSAPIAHQLLLLVSDEVAGSELPIAVWGRKASVRAAYGATTAVPVLGKTVETLLSLTSCTPGCQGDTLMTCTGAPKSCPLGCSEDGDAHCLAPSGSNGVDTTLADTLTGTTTISASTVFDTDTGAITGGISRPAGTDIKGGIGYFQAPASGAGGAALGIFAFHNLAIDETAMVRFTGVRAAVLLVGDTAGIAGVIDLSAGRGARSSPGPGGGAGGTSAAAAGGCGAGAAGGRTGTSDGGGGGGGAGETGAPGGGLTTALAGAGGAACLPALLEPLQGGGGGGRGGPGDAAMAASGGGGGGALQITALRVLVITGTITAGGAGGDAGPASTSDAGAGAGGGSGGALLLEAPMLTVAASAIVAANGGGGGGGGGVPALPASPGGDGGATDAFAQGGFGSESDNGGGTAGSALSPPDVGRDGETNGNAGGGGAGVGRIVLRGHTRVVSGKFSPPPMLADVKPPQ